MLLEGPRVVQTALEAGVRVRFALVSVSADGGGVNAPLLARLHEARVEVVELSEVELAQHADTEHPQGVLAVAEAPVPPHGLDSLLAGPGVILVFDALQDPGNAGTLVRSAAAFGARGVVFLDGSVDPWSAKVVRASAGEGFRVPVVSTSWADFDRWRRGAQIALVVADAGGTDVRLLDVRPPDLRPLKDVAPSAWPSAWMEAPSTPKPPTHPLNRLGSVALLVGNEGAGPRAEAREAADLVVALPLAHGVESLNAAVAGSLLLWIFGPGGAPAS